MGNGSEEKEIIDRTIMANRNFLEADKTRPDRSVDETEAAERQKQQYTDAKIKNNDHGGMPTRLGAFLATICFLGLAYALYQQAAGQAAMTWFSGLFTVLGMLISALFALGCNGLLVLDSKNYVGSMVQSVTKMFHFGNKHDE